MKISLDLHGVINDLPEVFQFITEAIIAKGGQVHILTGSSTNKAKEELIDLGYEEGIHFTHVMGLPDYLEDAGFTPTNYNHEYNNFEFSIMDWDQGKSLYCKQYDINLHMDDTIEYGEYFVTPFARLWTKNK